MSTPPSFPALAGLGWSSHKRPAFSTLVAAHVSGREVRDAQWQYPLWEFELTFDGLTDLSSPPANYVSLGSQSLQSLMGLFLQMQGQYGVFLYTDPTDNAVAAQALGVGDGTTTNFTFLRLMGGFAESVGWVTSVANVALDGVNQTLGWSLATPNSLVFATAPGAGATVSASFSYAFQCRFLDDIEDFEQFMENLWLLQRLKFRSVRSNT
jgi:hypothetical protein